MVELATFQPDIPQNLGGLIRLTSCLNIKLSIIEPCGFPLGDRKLKRVAMDYGNVSDIRRWPSWESFFENQSQKGRLILLSTKSNNYFFDFKYFDSDCLLVGQESYGVPLNVREACDFSVRIPIKKELRSLNVVTAGAIVLSEAIRQTSNYNNIL